jgi:hypothetical protein
MDEWQYFYRAAAHLNFAARYLGKATPRNDITLLAGQYLQCLGEWFRTFQKLHAIAPCFSWRAL